MMPGVPVLSQLLCGRTADLNVQQGMASCAATAPGLS